MPLESWIDDVCRVMAVDNGLGGTVKSYAVYERAEMPDAVTEVPCAITFVQGYMPYYSEKGPKSGFYYGRTEFHLVEGLNRSRIPFIMLFYARIRNAVAGKIALGGRTDIEHFGPSPRAELFIEGPVVLQWGGAEGQQNLGLIVNWEVKANENEDAGYVPAP